MDRLNAEIFNNILESESDFSSDEEDYEQIVLEPPHILFDENNDVDVGQVLQPLQVVQRVHRVKILNYIDNVVSAYVENDFIMHFRLSRQVTNELIGHFTTSATFLALQAHAGYEPISAEKHIISFLWYVGHESAGYRDVADRFGITISALHNVISRVTNFLMSIAPNVIRFPTLQERELTKQFYLQQKRFPGIIGAIDGSHIRIDKPLEDKDSYINRKQFFSIQLQGIVNHEQKFLNVFIGYPGSVHDARVFRESPVYNNLDILCEDDGYLLGDSAYPCLQRLIVPYRDNGHLTRAQINFNQRLSSCRVVIENV
ncbi:putative nuclease HARBI1 [Monomorium pharaonis]|uniref:putative nuclease HARBI1 n=1 Tax=Monomorium pharaonis TaxID=307658 RepID=UPI00102E1B57|nr:putative nuclease HARBI1 [Monomorium pharaonis]